MAHSDWPEFWIHNKVHYLTAARHQYNAKKFDREEKQLIASRRFRPAGFETRIFGVVIIFFSSFILLVGGLELLTFSLLFAGIGAAFLYLGATRISRLAERTAEVVRFQLETNELIDMLSMIDELQVSGDDLTKLIFKAQKLGKLPRHIPGFVP